MKTSLKILLVQLLFLASLGIAVSVKREGTHETIGVPPLQDISSTGPNYDLPPSFDQHQFDFQPSPSQFSPYQTYQPTYVDPGFGVQTSSGFFGDTNISRDWIDTGLTLLTAGIPVILSAIVLLILLTFFGLIKIPFVAKIPLFSRVLNDALVDVDVDQLVNTVNLAISKYQELFSID